MLALMCNIYRGENYIPKNRPDVYEKCAYMLFHRWDRSRGVRVSLPFEEHIDPALKHLAAWVYSSQKLQAGVTETKLIEETAKYLYRRRFDRFEDAKQASKGFISFCKGRAWVFTDTGTEVGGESLYQFTHRTFLEYFTAAHIVRTNTSPDKLLKVLLPKIERGEWDVVAQLAIQMLHKQVDASGDRVMRSLMKHSERIRKSKRAYVSSFLARMLAFLIPQTGTIRDVTRNCSRWSFLEIGQAYASVESASHRVLTRSYDHPASTLAGLFTSAAECFGPCSKGFEDAVRNTFKKGRPAERLAVADLLLNPELVLIAKRPAFAEEQLSQSWREKIWSLVERHGILLKQLSEKDPLLARIMLMSGKLSLEDVVKAHGLQCLFEPSHHRFATVVTSPPADSLVLLSVTEGYEGSERKEAYRNMLQALGRELSNRRPPWVRGGISGTFELPRMLEHSGVRHARGEGKLPDTFPPDDLFVCLLVMCIRFEQSDTPRQKEVVDILQHTLLAEFGFILEARLEGPKKEAPIEEVLSQRRLKEAQRKVIANWAGRKSSFVSGKR